MCASMGPMQQETWDLTDGWDVSQPVHGYLRCTRILTPNTCFAIAALAEFDSVYVRNESLQWAFT